MSPDRLWTVDDVAQFLRVASKTVRQWQRSGTLPFLKIGGTVRFVPDEIREWALSQNGNVDFVSHPGAATNHFHPADRPLHRRTGERLLDRPAAG